MCKVLLKFLEVWFTPGVLCPVQLEMPGCAPLPRRAPAAAAERDRTAHMLPSERS